MKLKDVNKEIDLYKLDSKSDNKIKCLVLSNFCFDPFFSKALILSGYKKNLTISIETLDLNEVYCNDNNLLFETADIVILWMNFEERYPFKASNFNEPINDVIEDSVRFLKVVNQKIRGQLIWISYEDCFMFNDCINGSFNQEESSMKKINTKIMKELKNEVIVYDLEKSLSCFGINNVYNFRNYTMWGNPYSYDFILFIANDIIDMIEATFVSMTKCIILDCDNVLWGGEILEKGLFNIELGLSFKGKLYQKFQYLIKILSKKGIVIALCSKNNKEDVISCFKDNKNMILDLNDISTYRINWLNKSQNIREIAEELNIGLQNIIFIDDSTYEINLVKIQIPEIKTIKFDLNNIFYNLKVFIANNSNENDVYLRIKTYKDNMDRYELKKQYTSIEEYLKSIKNQIQICYSSYSEIDRIVDLSLRTNKCSNHMRCNKKVIKKYLNSTQYKLYSVFVSDRFGDLGLVGCICVDTLNSCLELFCLSCRALGRNVEDQMIKHIKQHFSIVEIYFKKDNKNQNLYSKFLNQFGRVSFNDKFERK